MDAKIIWLTGLSGAGKTTLSIRLYKKLVKKFNIKKNKIKLIDGDKFRKKNKQINSFTKSNIIKNNIAIIRYIKKIEYLYKFIIVSVISPLKKTREIAKQTFGKNYFEIYIFCDLKTLQDRDTKGLYLKAKTKNLNNLIGYNSKIKYETSLHSKLIVNTKRLNKIKSTEKIIKYIF